MQETKQSAEDAGSSRSLSYLASRSDRSFGELFSQDGFDPHSFVSKYLSAASSTFQPTSLESLRVELKAYGERLKAQLVDLLNREYADFIGLASGLVGTRESIQAITQQLTDVRQRLQTVQQNVAQALAAVESKLEAGRVLNAQRASLELLTEVHQAVRRIKAALAMCKQLPRPDDVLSPASAELAVAADAQLASRQDPAYALFQQLMAEPLGDPASSSAGAAAASKESKLAPPADSKQATVAATTDDVLSHNAVLMERLARQLSALRIAMAQGARFELVRRLEEQVSLLEAEFEQRLCDAFAAAVARNHERALTQLLRAFAFSDKGALAEKIVRERVVRPLVQLHVSKDKLLQPTATADAKAGSAAVSKSPAQPSELLASMYSALLGSVRQQCGTLLSVAGRGSPFRFDFLGASVWSEIAEALGQLGPTLHSTGLPDAFHSNYTQSVQLLQQFEALCDDEDAVTRFRQHPSTVAFRARWNLPVYFSLRFQRIAAALEAAVQRAPVSDSKAAAAADGKAAESKAAAADGQLVLDATRTLWDCWEQCWSRSVWLPDLTDRFFKLTLQLLARYCSWLEQGLAAAASAGAATAPADAASPAAAAGGAASAASAATASVASGGWSEVALEALVLAYADVQTLLSRLPADLTALVMARLGGVSGDATGASAVRALIGGGVSAGAARLKSLAPQLADRVSGEIGRRCVEVLQPAVPRIKTQYRLTGLAPPTQPSAYVADVLGFLRSALWNNAPARRCLREGDRRRLAAAVCTTVAERFAAAASEMIDVFQKTESSLRRFAKSKQAAGGAGGGAGGNDVSDLFKIQKQVVLDAGELLRAFTGELELKEGDCAGVGVLARLVQTLEKAMTAGDD